MLLSRGTPSHRLCKGWSTFSSTSKDASWKLHNTPTSSQSFASLQFFISNIGASTSCINRPSRQSSHPVSRLAAIEPPTWIQHISDYAVRTTDNSITQPITAKATSHFFFTTSKSTTNPLYTIYIPWSTSLIWNQQLIQIKILCIFFPHCKCYCITSNIKFQFDCQGETFKMQKNFIVSHFCMKNNNIRNDRTLFSIQ